MAMLNQKNYLVHAHPTKNVDKVKYGSTRDWWLVKPHSSGRMGGALGIHFYYPKELVGKRIRVKVEVIEDGNGQ